MQLYNQSYPGIVDFIERLQAVIASYPDTYSLAEVGGREAAREMKEFTQGPQRLDSAYGFDFLYAPALTPALVANALERWPDTHGMGWPSWAFENHDAPRALSRWCAPEHVEGFSRLKMMVLLALRGNPILFQGEELGLLQDEVPYELLQDPEAIANWPLTLSRDGVRTPLPWKTQDEQGGFTHGTPWLPLSAQNLARSVDRQVNDPASLFNFTRELLAIRRQHPALRSGSCDIAVADDACLALRRRRGDALVTLVANMSDRAIAWPGAIAASGRVLAAVNEAEPGTLPAFGAIWFIEGVAV